MSCVSYPPSRPTRAQAWSRRAFLSARALANRLGHGGELLPNLRGRDGPFRRGGETLIRFVRRFRELENLGNACRRDVEHMKDRGQKNPEIEPEAPGIHIVQIERQLAADHAKVRVGGLQDLSKSRETGPNHVPPLVIG